jgi:hypothetical protein
MAASPSKAAPNVLHGISQGTQGRQMIHLRTALVTAIFVWQFAPACAQDSSEEKPLGVILAAGDIAECNGNGHKTTAAILRKQMADVKDKLGVPVVVLVLGDLGYPGGGQSELNCFHSSWGKAVAEGASVADPSNELLQKPENRLMPVPGNHDVRGAARYFRHFKSKENPWVGQQGEKTGYFVADFPNAQGDHWRLIGLDSELRGSAMSKQNTWLGEKLNESNARCVVAFWHRPLISSGDHGHGDCGSACQKQNAPVCRPDMVSNNSTSAGLTAMKKAYTQLYQRGASLVLTGHDHHFEQFGRHDPDAKSDQAKGLRSFVIGTGGINLYQTARDFRWQPPIGEVYGHDFHGILRIDLYKDRYRWTFVSKNDEHPISFKVGDVVVDNDTCNVRQ